MAKIKWFLWAIWGIGHVSLLPGQAYRPFHPGLTYVYDCQYVRLSDGIRLEGLYGLAIDSVGTEGTDSVFFFNVIGRTGQIWDTLIPGSDNLFGQRMLDRGQGMYLLLTGTSDSFFIQTQVPLQTTWTFHPGTGTTATLLDKGAQQVWGMADTVLSIALSSGDTLLLSRSYGLLRGRAFLPIDSIAVSNNYPAWGYWFGIFSMTGPLELAGLPELGLGEKMPWVEEIYDFAPGESFLLASHGYCDHDWAYTLTWLTVLERSESLDGDTLRYRMARKRIEIDETWTGLDTTYLGQDTVYWTFVRDEMPIWSSAASGARFLSFEIKGNLQMSGPFRFDSYNKRPLMNFQSYLYEPTLDRYISISTVSIEDVVVGLGKTYFKYTVLVPQFGHCLVWAAKHTDTVGVYIAPETLVSIDEPRGQSGPRIFPNPFQQELEISLCWDRPVDRWQLAISDIQGRVVASKEVPRAPCLETRWWLAHLPPGMYFLYLTPGNGGTPVVRPIVKR